ncbi:hypothetical protein PoB_005295200 [Plakobranchus ocellatus]|uniref:Uncharacterized protein n=1 Tax=Plakobranchus ocellatus TaxID=259542 RepID=A0AAV4C598_9GAST|nr:hypothetical protein PoB_005295200 [Plakobranchus ocellatus]
MWFHYVFWLRVQRLSCFFAFFPFKTFLVHFLACTYFLRGALAHLEGQLTNKSEVRVRVPVQAKSIFIAAPYPPSTEMGSLVSQDPTKSKGGEESNGKLPQNAVYAKNNQDLNGASVAP